MQRLKLLIADHAPTCAGVRVALGDQVDSAEASDASHAIRAAHRDRPDLCLVGRDLAGGWLSAVRGIRRAAPEASVVVLAHEPNVDDLLEAIRTGAIGYMPGPLDGARLRNIVSAIAVNEAVIPRAMVLELLMELRGAGGGGDGLTTRESQVLGMLRRGHNTAAIAERLAIAPVTVRRHISELVHKLGVENRAALIRS
jgi:DNA-binding NarL/FixJ family response regulator